MKSIQIEDDLYHFIASQTQDIGESASDILRRLVMPESLLNTAQDNSVKETKVYTIDSDVSDVQSTEPTCQASAVFAELEGQQLQAIPKMVERWLLVLSIIHKHHSQQFSKVLSMSGRNRTYFATDKDTLLATGSSTNPKNVPDSVYWVITNNNTAKKINMLKGVAEQVGFNLSEVEELIKIFAPELI
ncbi:replication initiation negative regulator SeqA [Paraglaciecola arctica]|uniref:Negative modulator of initiation of replication n=1 Tax=Paraglaciecola arctica BSs20135 TaxID=493475 RepID=K6X932_9ALTE|nr:replication initiation negative regulator SeqA [Paraglaciecola arctica]GAC17144.1 negative modulator of initiation of replication [Paraglaciecola arctica BSs20135]|tara:strand:- start:3132 stop:3695 length:564 start_codon:yes stop_codon:yes gene_type:complete